MELSRLPTTTATIVAANLASFLGRMKYASKAITTVMQTQTIKRIAGDFNRNASIGFFIN